MDPIAKEYVISFYNQSLSRFGDSPAAVKWTAQGQRLRFESLSRIIGNMSGKKVLDYGCGKGDFYQFLKNKQIQVDYTGFDINANFIKVARNKYPECDFRVFDIEERELDEKFDYIVLCGVFNLKLDNLIETVQKILTSLFKYCSIALIFNALSSYEPNKHYELQYYNPAHLMDFAANNLSPYISLFHDSVPYDLTLMVQKDSACLL